MRILVLVGLLALAGCGPESNPPHGPVVFTPWEPPAQQPIYRPPMNCVNLGGGNFTCY